MKKNILSLFLAGVLFSYGNAQSLNNAFENVSEFYDTYHHVAGIADSAHWNLANVHDPTVYKDGDYYYMYSTDASWGGAAKNGALKRRSKDLINWEYMGNAFNGVPESAKEFFRKNGNPNYDDSGIWAPFLFKLNNKFILYYSAPGGVDGVTLAALGYATSTSANGPWQDQGLITTSAPLDTLNGILIQDTINAIDPSVVFDSLTQKLWMLYGSWHYGLYALELNAATGGVKRVGDRGKRIANRKNSGYGQEGPEISYRNGWYYLYQTYDPLGDVYNTRVGRARTPQGPYYDYLGNDLTNKTDNLPMILSPYAFNDHFGWQGTGHCGVYNDEGVYYMFHQGRPTVDPAMMVGHVREIKWIDDWPVLSPERSAGNFTQVSVTVQDIIGDWEHMNLDYHPSAASDFLNYADVIAFDEDGSLNGSQGNTWTFSDDTLKITWESGISQKLLVFAGWDWENQTQTMLYSGIGSDAICAWGKKINQTQSEKFNSIVDGATYTIRSAYSHLVVQAPSADYIPNITINQAKENDDETQCWTIRNAGGGYYYLLPRHGNQELALGAQNGSANNGAGFVVDSLTSDESQKFKLNYHGNGYYSVATRITKGEKGFDLWGFSTIDGGEIRQYDYTKGWHQNWRLERIDSIAIDLSAIVDTTTTPDVEDPIVQSMYEPFLYSAGLINGQGSKGNGWGGAWYISGETSNLALSEGLTYPNLTTTGKSLKITSVDGSGTEAIRDLGGVWANDGSTYWMSYLCTIENPEGENNSWQGISLNLDDAEQLYLGKIWGSSFMGINDPDPYFNFISTYEYSSGLAWYVICVKTAGKNTVDSAYMWINADPLQEPNFNHADVKCSASINGGFNKVRVHLGQTAGITINIDELKFGSSFDEVSNGMAIGVDQPEIAQSIAVQVYPNPVSDNLTFVYEVDCSENVSLEIYNALGTKVVTVVDNVAQNQGKHSIVVNLSDLKPAIYLYYLKVGLKYEVGKIIKH